jgi:uncharacterized protein DUF2272
MRAAVCAVVLGVGLAAQPAFAQADRAAASFWKSVQATCNAAAAKPPSERGRRIAQVAVDEFTRFGGHRIDADGRIFHFGLTEAEHEEDDGGGRPARLDRLGWWQVMKYWLALFGDDTMHKLEVRGYSDASTSSEDAKLAALVRTTAARLLSLAEQTSDPAEREMLREAALRAAVVDTSWSAAFVSYVVKQAGVAEDGFRFANAHHAYIYDAFATSAAEVAKQGDDHVYRACPITTTRPRPGDVICNQRESALSGAGEEEVRERIRADLAAGTTGFARAIRRTHCEVVAHVDAGARKLYTIGGNVNQAVAARKLNLRRNLTFSSAQKGHCGGLGHWTMPQGAPAQVAAAGTSPVAAQASQGPGATPKCSLNDKKWFVLLQVR